MLNLNPLHYPLSQTKDIQAIYRWFRNELIKEDGIISEPEGQLHMINLIRNGYPNFYFRVFRPHQEGVKPYYHLRYVPENEDTFDTTEYNLQFDEIKQRFYVWLSLVKQYDSVSFTHDDYLTRLYEDDFYQSFEFENEESVNKPFDHERQILIFYCLEGVSNGLKKADAKDSEIIELIRETEDLKNNIQNFGRRPIARKISKLMAKIKKKGIPLLVSVGEEIKKEFIKRGIDIVFNGIGNLLNHHNSL